MSSPRIIKTRSEHEQTPAWAPDDIGEACAGGFDPFYLVSGPALPDAAGLSAQARAEALACIEAAKAQAAQIHAEARDHGLEEARRAAEEHQERLTADVQTRLCGLVDEINREREQFFGRVEPEIVSLAVSVAEKVIAQEIAAHPEIVLNLVRNSMKRMKERETLRVRLNPQDLEVVRAAREELISAVDGVQRLELVEDRRVDPGGCIVESRNGNLDARIRTQLSKIERVISEAACGEQGRTTHGDSADAGSFALPTAGQPHGSG